MFGCASGATAKRRLGMPAYSPTDWRYVAVVSMQPAGEFEIIGEVYGTGIRAGSGSGAAYKRMQQAAAKIGGDGVVLIKEGYIQPSPLRQSQRQRFERQKVQPEEQIGEGLAQIAEGLSPDWEANGVVIRFIDRRLGAPPAKEKRGK